MNNENKTQESTNDISQSQLYYYMRSHYVGKDNAIDRFLLAIELGITERELRKLIKGINASNEFEYLISPSRKCYMCETDEERERVINNTYKVAISLLTKAKRMESKAGIKMKYKINKDDYESIMGLFEVE